MLSMNLAVFGRGASLSWLPLRHGTVDGSARSFGLYNLRSLALWSKMGPSKGRGPLNTKRAPRLKKGPGASEVAFRQLKSGRGMAQSAWDGIPRKAWMAAHGHVLLGFFFVNPMLFPILKA